MDRTQILDVTTLARQVIATEVSALNRMADNLGDNFARAVDLILGRRGRLMVMGMGKSGIIGKKITATLASTGTPAYFVHPGEAFHGDLGMIRPNDVALLISNSGETEELIRLIPFFQHQQNTIIAMTGKTDSTLARHATVVLDISVEREACNNNLAPTSSTTATLVMGDALAVVLSTLRGFQPEDFARFHPGGSLGRRLLTRVKDIMRTGALPTNASTDTLRDVVHEITRGRLGLALIVDAERLVGLVTDGDLRRALDTYADPLSMQAADIMTRNPKTITPDERYAEAEQAMTDAQVSALVVVSEDRRPIGVLHILDFH